MATRKYVSTSMLLLTLMLLPVLVAFPQQAVVGQDNTILAPQIHQAQTYSAGSGNDLFFRAPSYFKVFDNLLLTSTTQATLNEYQGMDYSENQATILPQTYFSLDPNRISQLNNQSSTPMTVSFDNYYYDLFGNINVSASGDGFSFDGVIPLYSNAQYGFAITVNGTDPLALSLVLSGGDSPNIDFDFWAISPEFENYGFFSRSITVGVESLIPMIFPKSGSYMIIFKPDDFSLLSSLRVYNNLPISDFNDGIADTIKGTKSMIQFFKINPENARAFRFFYNVKNYDYVLDTSQYNKQTGVNYLGRLDISYYTFPASDLSGMFPFGISMFWPSAFGSLQYADSNTPIYVSVIAEPPNEDDPSVRAIRQDLGLDPGYEYQYSVWTESQPVPSLPLNASFVVTPQFSSSTTNLYLYSTTTDVILSLNSTTTAHADIYNVETFEYYKLDSSVHDKLNSPTDNLFLLPPGDYLVYLHKGDYLYFTEFPITTLDAPDLSQGPTANTSLSLQSILKTPLFLRLPTDQLTADSLVFEYLDKANRSVQLAISLYDSQGYLFYNAYRTFQYIGNNVDPEWSVVNSTTISSPKFNVKGGFLEIHQTNNALYNTSVSNPQGVPLLDENDPELVSNFRVTRRDDIAYQNATNPLSEFFSLPLANITIPELNQTVSYSGALFTLSGEQKAYRITGLATNFSISVAQFMPDSINLWFTLTGADIISETINGTTYERFEIELALDMPGQYGLFVGFSPPSSPNNGTFSLTVEELPIHDFLDPVFTEIPAMPYSRAITGESSSESSFSRLTNWIKSNALLSGGIFLALVALVAGGVLLYKKRK